MLKSKPKQAAPAPVAASAAGDNLASPSGAKSSVLRAQRRRLSVVSDNQFIEGVAPPGDTEEEDVTAKVSAESVVKVYAGVSKKGYAPYNPRKRNQDAIFMEEVVGPVKMARHMATTTTTKPQQGAGAAPAGGSNSSQVSSVTATSGSASGSTSSPLAAGLGSLNLDPAANAASSSSSTAAAGTGSGMRYAKTHVFGVFDGHGEAGDLVSHHFAERLPGLLAAHPKWASDPATALVEQIDALEKQLLADASIDSEFSGSTGIVAVVRLDQLIVANIGDSRCILGRAQQQQQQQQQAAAAAATGALTGGGSRRNSASAPPPIEAVAVSDDHKPDRPDEQRRITSRGGRVFAVEYDDGVDGPPRVWLAHMDIPGLAMSRSLGDTVAHTVGVISAPEMSSLQLTSDDKILVLASDGLWEFISNQEVINMASSFDDPRKAVDALIAEANARWMREEQVIDDTTVIVAYLDVRPTPPAAAAGACQPVASDGAGDHHSSSSSSAAAAAGQPAAATGVRMAVASASGAVSGASKQTL